MSSFFIQDDNTKETKRDHRGRLKGKHRELERKSRYRKRGHGREDTCSGMCAVEIELDYVGLLRLNFF